MDILKLAAIGVAAALCALAIKRQVPELALVLTLSAGVALMAQALEAASSVRGFTDALARTAGLAPEVWKPVWKTVGIGVVTQLGAAVCKDAGEGGIAAVLETAGAALSLLAALPLVETVFDTLGGFL